MDDKLVAIFDYCKISDRNAVRLIMALCSSLNIDVNPLIVNRSSIHRIREKIREENVQQTKELFKTEDLNANVLHWEGKILKTSSGKNKERLPIVLSYGQIEKILAILVLDDGTGQSQADSRFDAINNWGISDCIKAVFELKIPATSGPDVPLFKSFREHWTEIDTSQYSTGIEDEYVQDKIQNHIEDINQFIK